MSCDHEQTTKHIDFRAITIRKVKARTKRRNWTELAVSSSKNKSYQFSSDKIGLRRLNGVGGLRD